MSKHLTLPFAPPLVDNERFNMNGNVPSAAVGKRLAETFNFVSGRCKKQVLLKVQPLFEVAAGSATLQYLWSTYFVTGENTTRLVVIAGLALTDYAFSSIPTMTIRVNSGTSSTQVASIGLVFAGSVASTSVAPDQINYKQSEITGLSPNTAYNIQCSISEGLRPVFLSVAEGPSNHADDTVTAVCDPGQYVAEGAIYDAQISDLVEANNELWQHNGAHLVNWAAYGVDEDVKAPLVNWTNYANIVNGASPISQASPGWNLQTLYHNTVNRTTVPVRAAVKVLRTTGTGTFDWRFTDGTNTVGATGASGSGTQWLIANGTIPAQAGTKWDFHAKVSSGSWLVQAVCLLEYET